MRYYIFHLSLPDSKNHRRTLFHTLLDINKNCNVFFMSLRLYPKLALQGPAVIQNLNKKLSTK